MTVGEYVLLGRTPHLGTLAKEGKRDRDVAARALDRLDLHGFGGRPLGTLSGGEKQRAVVARALAQEARIVLLDEPTAALDIGHQQQALELLDTLRVESGLTLVAAMHDLTLAAQYAERMVLLDARPHRRRGRPLGRADRGSGRDPLRRVDRRRPGERPDRGRPAPSLVAPRPQRLCGLRVPRLVEQQRVPRPAARASFRARSRSPRSRPRTSRPSPPAPRASPRCRRTSARSRGVAADEYSSPSKVPDVGWTPISLGPVLKMSQPGSDSACSTYGQPRTSRKNARVASASSE